ncbi:heterokaryon incompatibility protein-domain-containing protein [Podospora fimiseda]|uniref:Heterokaryon incompatibility protein-domain-containing protein n=1 Tax=Podospora fimiseda TaxID=252190 RepID=A0AAN7BGJ1_9PEZI|nr:heterokaryon incompatibility protein-domain-containing protein [Podospora fimiseda]
MPTPNQIDTAEGIIMTLLNSLSFCHVYLLINARRAFIHVQLDPSFLLRIVCYWILLRLNVYVHGLLVDFHGTAWDRFSGAKTCLEFDILLWSYSIFRFFYPQGEPALSWLTLQLNLTGGSNQLVRLMDGGAFNSRSNNVKKLDPSLPPYQYKDLSDPRAIRLLVITPLRDGQGDRTPIECSMEEFALDSAPYFTALSYAWDSDGGTASVVCDGGLIPATMNCVAALRNFRRGVAVPKDAKRGWIWVDAVCINQNTSAVKEKSHQIAIMGDIYRRAASVRVWLGERDKYSKLAYQYFGKVSATQEEQSLFFAEYDSERTPEKLGLEMARQWPKLSTSLVEFFSRSWFTRAWPVQEVTLPDSARVTVVCGNEHLKLDSIRRGLDLLRKLNVLPVSAGIDQAVALQFYLADAIALKRGKAPDHGLLKDFSQFSFTRVMHAMRLKACRDPKDRFFSLYGVFKELGVDHGIPISMWTEPDHKVFEAIAMACVRLDGNLNILRLAQMQDPYTRLSNNFFLYARPNPYDTFSTFVQAMSWRIRRTRKNALTERDIYYSPDSDVEWLKALPSWVPDWTQTISSDINDACRITLLDCSDTSIARVSYNLDLDGQQIIVQGKMIGRIDDIGTVNSVKLLWQVGEVFRTCQPNKHPSSPDPLISALVETFVTHTLWSPLSQIFVSLSMAFRTLDIFDIGSYISSAWTAKTYFTDRIFQLLCSRMVSVASCPTDGANMRRIFSFKIEFFSESHAISQAISVFLKGRVGLNRDMWRQSAGDVVFNIGGLLWYFRVSIIESLFNKNYEEMHSLIVAPIMALIISVVTQDIAMFMGDTSLYLLAWSLGVVANFVYFIAFMFYIPRYVWFGIVAAIMLFLGARLANSEPEQILTSIAIYSNSFRERGSLVGYDGHELHFFVTDTCITGSTTGPIGTKHGDCLVQIKGCASGGGYLILRPKTESGKSYAIVGAAYVGSRKTADTEAATAEWEEIELV